MLRFLAPHVYEVAWWSLIVLLDRCILLRTGRSPIARAPLRFLLLSLWSVAFWFSFELINLRIRNWHYIFVGPGEGERWLGSFLAFATVLPAIALSAELIDALIPRPSAAARLDGRDSGGRRSRRVPPWLPGALASLGLAFLALPLAWPRYFYPLVWGGVVLVLDPLNRLRGAPSLLGEWEAGRARVFAVVLAAGAFCGLIWELLNYWARVKWVYTVPFFEELKLFEMPLPGFLGFPPFALECWVFIRSLEAFRLLPREGEPPPREPIFSAGRLAAALAVSSLVAAVALPAMDQITIASLYPLVDDLPGLSPSLRAELRERRIVDCFDLREDLERRGDRSSALRRRVDLVLLAGIGIEKAEALRGIGIDSVAALAAADPSELTERIEAIDPVRRPSAAEVRYWVRAARR